MDATEIRTDRLLLRPWRPADAAAVTAACDDEQIARWTTLPVPYTESDGRAWTETVAPALWESGTATPFAVCEAGTGRLLAACGLHGIKDRAAEIGYWCAAEARGAGVMTEAVLAVSRWGFDSLGLERIAWIAAVGNWASRRVAERCGYAVEGVLRAGMSQRGQRLDCWVGGRLAGDPEADTRRLPAYVPLSDGVVRLRPWHAEDVPAIVRGYDDPERARWLPGPTPYTADDARAYLASIAAEPYDGTGLPLAVTDVGTGAVVGAVHLHLRGRELGGGEIGYWTAPHARGRGVASRAARLLSDWAFRELGLARVGVLVAVGNAASQAAAEKAGFEREGVLRAVRPDPHGGPPRDMVSFSRVR
jgi:RimJ/RimL family protein N-acetyltransferase